jgi:nucleoside-diphosphate-sugar epimerase
MGAEVVVAYGSAVNAGRSDRLTINEAADLIFTLVGWRPCKIERDLSKPEGVASRAADLTKAKEVIGWTPKVSYQEGFKKTVDWYFATHKIANVKKNLDKLLLER